MEKSEVQNTTDFLLPETSEIHSMAQAGFDLFLSDSYNHRILRMNSITGELKSWQESDLSLAYPTGLATSNERLYVCDSWHHRILCLTFDGALIQSTGHYGSDEVAFDSPEGIGVSPDGLLWVADMGNDRIKIYNSQMELQRIILGSSLLETRQEPLAEWSRTRSGSDRFFPRDLAFSQEFWAVKGNQWLCVYENLELRWAWFSLHWAEFRMIGLQAHKPVVLRKDGGIFLLDPDQAQPREVAAILSARGGFLVDGQIVVFSGTKKQSFFIHSQGMNNAAPFAILARNRQPPEFSTSPSANSDPDPRMLFQILEEAGQTLVEGMAGVMPSLEEISPDHIQCGFESHQSLYFKNRLDFNHLKGFIAPHLFKDKAREIHYLYCDRVFRHLFMCQNLLNMIDNIRPQVQGAPDTVLAWTEKTLVLAGNWINKREDYLKRLPPDMTLEELRRSDWVLFHYNRLLLYLNDLLCAFLSPITLKTGQSPMFPFGSYLPHTVHQLEAMLYRCGYAGVASGSVLENWQIRSASVRELVLLETNRYLTGIATESNYRQSLLIQNRDLRERFLAGHCFMDANTRSLSLFYYLAGWKQDLDALLSHFQSDKVNLFDHASVLARVSGWLGRIEDLALFQGILNGETVLAERAYALIPEQLHDLFITMGTAYMRNGYIEKGSVILSNLPEDMRTYYESMALFRGCQPGALEYASQDSRLGPNYAVRSLSLLGCGRVDEANQALDLWKKKDSGLWPDFIRGLVLGFNGQFMQAKTLFDQFGDRLLTGNLQKGILCRRMGACEEALTYFEKEARQLPHWIVALHRAMTFKRCNLEKEAEDCLDSLPEYALVIWEGKPVPRNNPDFRKVLNLYLELEQQDLQAIAQPDFPMMPFYSYLNFISLAACRSLTLNPFPSRDWDQSPGPIS